MNSIREGYVRLRGTTGKTNLELYDAYMSGKTILDLSEEYAYHPHTVYHKIGEVDAYISSYYEYSLRLDRLSIDVPSKRSLILVLMTLSKYVRTEKQYISRKDMVCRFPALKSKNVMAKEIDNMFLAKALPNGTDPFRIYDDILYKSCSLHYQLSDSIMEYLNWQKESQNSNSMK